MSGRVCGTPARPWGRVSVAGEGCGVGGAPWAAGRGRPKRTGGYLVTKMGRKSGCLVTEFPVFCVCVCYNKCARYCGVSTMELHND